MAKKKMAQAVTIVPPVPPFDNLKHLTDLSIGEFFLFHGDLWVVDPDYNGMCISDPYEKLCLGEIVATPVDVTITWELRK